MPALSRDFRDHLRLLRWGGLAAWLGVGLPIWLQLDAVQSPRAFAGWLAAWLLFAVAFTATAAGRPRSRRTELALLALQAACVALLALLLCDGFEGTLLVLVAMQLAGRVSRRQGLAWIAVQSLVLGAAVAVHWSPRPAFLLVPPYLGFQILAFLTFEALDREARGREELARINAELRSARELLAHGSRWPSGCGSPASCTTPWGTGWWPSPSTWSSPRTMRRRQPASPSRPPSRSPACC